MTATHHQPPTTNQEPPTNDHQPLTTNHWPHGGQLHCDNCGRIQKFSSLQAITYNRCGRWPKCCRHTMRTGPAGPYRIGRLLEPQPGDPTYNDQAIAEQAAQTLSAFGPRGWSSFDAPIAIWSGPNDEDLITIIYHGQLYRLT